MTGTVITKAEARAAFHNLRSYRAAQGDGEGWSDCKTCRGAGTVLGMQCRTCSGMGRTPPAPPADDRAETIDTSSYLSAADALLRRYNISVEWTDPPLVLRSDYLTPDGAVANIEQRHIEAQLPMTASSWGTFAHELCHILLVDLDQPGEATSWRELRASKGAIEITRRLFPEAVGRVEYKLGRHLTGYLKADLDAGNITRSEVEERVQPALLPYPDRLGGVRTESSPVRMVDGYLEQWGPAF